MEGDKIKISKSWLGFFSGIIALFVVIIYVKTFFHFLNKFTPAPVAKENKYSIFIVSLVSAIFIFVLVYDFLYKHIPKINAFKIKRGNGINTLFAPNPKFLFPLKSKRVKKKGRVHFCRKDSVALKLNSSKVLKLNRSLNDRHR